MKILYVTTISATINAFFKEHIKMLFDEGHQVDIACNYKELPIDNYYENLGCTYYQINFSRTPISSDNMNAYRQLKKLINDEHYDIVHCHTPIAAVITRLVCKNFRKKQGLKVLYTAHGFHFYKGAPKLNWIVYYPLEKICSKYTDLLITINREDYELAKKKFNAITIEYVKGVGIDIERFRDATVDINQKRKELGLPEDAFVITSVGELNSNKNHEVIIKALSLLKEKDIYYLIAGVGPLEKYLRNLAQELNLAETVHLLGFRNDISEIYKVSDICIFPSKREGLGVAAIEGMATGLPIIAANNRGTREYVEHNSNGFYVEYSDINGFKEAIHKLYYNDELRISFGTAGQIKAHEFDKDNIISIMKKIYINCIRK